MNRRLDGARALVTGGGRGIGRAAAVSLGELGASVTVLSRTLAELEETAELVRATGAAASVVECDVCDDAQVADAVARLDVDVLVNSAGSNVPAAFTDVNLADYDAVMALNTRAAFVVTQHVVRLLLARGAGGSIVNVTSQMAHVGGPNRSVYCASKAAVEGMSRALAVELAPHGIRVNCVAPTFIETELTARFLADGEFRSWALGEIPMGRFGTVDEVAAAIVFLAGNGASLITGTSLRVDGGWTAH